MELTINNISKTYGTEVALNCFSATLDTGIYALLGPNGSGKSTLMNIITDNLKADSGEITCDGENILDMGIRFREKIGFMPQYPGLYPNFSVERFMWYMAALKGVSKKDSAVQIQEILKEMELSDVIHRKIKTLSGGMKQRLALAQAVLGDPKILILDEPTAGLDPRQRISIRNYIPKISLSKIVIIATHVVSDIEFIAKKVIMLKKGVIVDNATPGELINKIDGKVWLVTCDEADVQILQSMFRVTNISGDGDSGRVLLRVLSDLPPNEGARSVKATLEDYYLYVFGENEGVSIN